MAEHEVKKEQLINWKILKQSEGQLLATNAYALLEEDNRYSASRLAEKIGVASRNVEANIKKLREQGILVRHGSPKTGYWEVENK